MIEPLQEVLIGYRLDAQVGPVITLAPGAFWWAFTMTKPSDWRLFPMPRPWK